MRKIEIKYPYTPAGRTYLYVGSGNPYIQMAREFVIGKELERFIPTAAIIIKNDIVIGKGYKGGEYHLAHGCERVKLHMPTGQGYELCPGCSVENHAEPTALRDVFTNGNNPKDADIYLWGHWWCCKDCWDSMIAAGIRNVYLLENSQVLFNRDDPNNVIGHQFDY